MTAVAKIEVQHGKLLDITDFVQSFLNDSGIVTITVMDSQASVFLSSAGRETDKDICADMERAFPARCSYVSQKQPTDTWATVISAVMGVQQSIPYRKGKLLLGSNQSVHLLYLGHGDSVQLCLMCEE